MYTVEQENWEDQEQKLGVPSMQQRLLLFLFLQHSDPFTLQLSDIMGERQLHVYKHRTCRLCWSLLHFFFSSVILLSATEVLIEHHLEDILKHNRQAVIKGLQTELKNTLKAQNRRKKASL